MYKKVSVFILVIILVILGVYMLKSLDESKAKADKKIKLCLTLKAKARESNVVLAKRVTKLVEKLSVDVVTVHASAVQNARVQIKERKLLCERYSTSPCSEWAATVISEYKFLIEICQNRGLKHCPSKKSWRKLWHQIIKVNCN
ncbi:hypothetical protein KKH43_01060 [Patescibacteria group bacterium]|nr:hypothetical protein [Patescibacteria group bacterium]